MIEFHAGSGPDSQAIGIALEEMFLDYRVMPGRAPVPVIVLAGARVVGAPNVLMALARKTGRFLPADGGGGWLGPAPPESARLEATLEAARFVAGDYSVADMALYPPLAADAAAVAHANIARWLGEVSKRPAAGRGMGVVT